MVRFTIACVLPKTHTRDSLLWSRTCYVGISLYVLGFSLLGATIQHKLGLPAFIFAWGIAQISVLVTTVAVCECEGHMGYFRFNWFLWADAYCNDCFPHKRGEISALLNLVRVLGGTFPLLTQGDKFKSEKKLFPFRVQCCLLSSVMGIEKWSTSDAWMWSSVGIVCNV